MVAEAEAGLIKVASPPDKLSDETEMLGQKWPWQASLTPTPNPKIQELNVDVYSQSKHAKLIHLTSYLYAQ